MKALAKILIGGFVVFMVLAVGQRWDYFSSSWFGGGEAALVLTEADKEASVLAVRVLLSASGHLLSSGGDERFADRMKAAEQVRAEILADVAYLRHNRLLQDSTLVRLEVRSTEQVAPQRVEVLTREFWVHRLLSRDEQTPVQEPISQIILGNYVVGSQDGQWRVLAWDFDPPQVVPGTGNDQEHPAESPAVGESDANSGSEVQAP